ncbi:MAG: MotA/TolQ/ExbB proton channel family protein [Cyanobacteria bacterium P01_H01_bin.15]
MGALTFLLSTGGVVIWPLLGCSILAVAIIFERSLFWRKISVNYPKLVNHFYTLFERDPNLAIAFLQRQSHLPLARIFLAALLLKYPNPEKFRLALETAAKAEIPLLKRFNNLFDTIISVAPLLGLLGTVLGLITSLGALRLGEIATTESSQVTAGIGEALTSTAAGLVIAITTLLFANLFRGLYLRQIALIDEYGGQLELLYLQQHDPGVQSDAST